MNNKKQLFISSAKTGLLIGAGLILISLILYIAGVLPVGILKPILLVVLNIAVCVVVLVISLKKVRTAAGGILTFGDAFLYGLVALLTGFIVSTVYSYVFNEFFDPAYMKNILEAQKDWMEGYLQGKMSDEQIQEQLDAMDAQMDLSFAAKYLRPLRIYLVFAAIVSLIIAAAMKKNPSVFEGNKDVI